MWSLSTDPELILSTWRMLKPQPVAHKHYSNCFSLWIRIQNYAHAKWMGLYKAKFTFVLIIVRKIMKILIIKNRLCYNRKENGKIYAHCIQY